METCSLLSDIFCQINWLWFIISVIIAYAVGALWYSVLFSKTWMRIFKIEMPEKPQTSNMVVTMLMQLVVTILYGLLFFILVSISVWIGVLTLLVFCGWQKGGLKFQFVRWNEFSMAAIISAGHTFITGLIFILFALI